MEELCQLVHTIEVSARAKNGKPLSHFDILFIISEKITTCSTLASCCLVWWKFYQIFVSQLRKNIPITGTKTPGHMARLLSGISILPCKKLSVNVCLAHDLALTKCLKRVYYLESLSISYLLPAANDTQKIIISTVLMPNFLCLGQVMRWRGCLRTLGLLTSPFTAAKIRN